MIDIRDYDLAMTERIKLFFDNTHWINRPTIPVKEIRDRKLINGTDVEFPIITVRRTNCPILSKEYNSWSRAKSGLNYNVNPDKNDIRSLYNYDPELAKKIADTGHNDSIEVVNSAFDLTYYIDIISFERDNFDTIVVELQENLFRVPYISFTNIKSDNKQDTLIPGQACHLLLEDLEDASNLENFDSENAMYRATLTVKMYAYIHRKYKAFGFDNIIINPSINGSFIIDYSGDNTGFDPSNPNPDLDHSGKRGFIINYMVNNLKSLSDKKE